MSTERTTRQCPVNELHPSLRQAIQEYFQSHGLSDPETGTRLCCETLTLRRPSVRWISFLEGNVDATSRLGLLLTSDWLVWAMSGDQSGLVAAGIKLKVLRTKVMVVRRSEEFHLEISGFVNDTKEYIRGAFELGSQPAAQKFCEAASTAALEQNPPSSKERRRWFGI